MDAGESAGGSLQLLALIEEHPDELEGDLLVLCGTDIRDAYRLGTGLTPRRCLLLIRRLAYDPRSLWRARLLAELPLGGDIERDPAAQWVGETATTAAVRDLDDDLRALFGDSAPRPRPGRTPKSRLIAPSVAAMPGAIPRTHDQNGRTHG